MPIYKICTYIFMNRTKGIRDEISDYNKSLLYALAISPGIN